MIIFSNLTNLLHETFLLYFSSGLSTIHPHLKNLRNNYATLVFPIN